MPKNLFVGLLGDAERAAERKRNGDPYYSNEFSKKVRQDKGSAVVHRRK